MSRCTPDAPLRTVTPAGTAGVFHPLRRFPARAAGLRRPLPRIAPSAGASNPGKLLIGVGECDTSTDMTSKQLIVQEITDILAASPEQRARAIIESPHLREILEELPVQDTYMILKEAWDTEGSILMPFVPPERFPYFVDLDCWQGGVLTLDSLQEWLLALLDASPDTLIAVLDALDLEVLVLLFQRHLEVVQVSPIDDNIPDLMQLGYESIDDTFFYRFIGESDEEALLQEVLHLIFSHLQNLYYHLMLGVCCELPSFLEEQAYMLRRLRLVELGFETPDEAVSIYRRVRAESLDAPGMRPELTPRTAPGEILLPSVYLDPLETGSEIICRAIDEAPRATRERLQIEMVYLANKVIMADFKPLNDFASMRDAVHKAAAISSLGLELLMQRQGHTRAQALEDSNAETLFSLGYNALLDAQRQLKTLLGKLELRLIPARMLELVEGLLRKRPAYGMRDFSTLAELEHVRETLAVLEAMTTLVTMSGGWAPQVSLSDTNVASPQGLDLENILLTALAVNTTDQCLVFRPLTPGEMTAFLTKATQRDASGKRTLAPGLTEDMASLLAALAPAQPEAIVLKTARHLAERLGEELEGIGDLSDIDSRFVTCLVVQSE